MQVRQMRQVTESQSSQYIIIDTHGGNEDVVAIVHAIRVAEVLGIKILGITCTNGIRTLEKAVDDALVANKIANAKISIFKGSKQSILLNSNYPKTVNQPCNYDTLDALYCKLVKEEDRALIQSKSAFKFIAQSIKAHEKQLSIITLGPLTNLAISFHLNNSLTNLNSVFITGGQFSGVGNVRGRNSVQGNFGYDPQAAHIVISNFHNIYLNPLEKILQSSWKDIFSALIQKESSAQFIQLYEQLNKNHSICGPLLTIIAAFEKKSISSTFKVYCEVILQGEHINGLLAANWLRLQVNQEKGEQKPNVSIFAKINWDAIKRVLAWK